MSFVIAQPEMIAAAAGELASIRSAINAANAAAAAQTTGVMSAAADEVSTAVAALFSSHAQAYQAASAQAAAFHAQVVRTLTVDAGAYASAEAANAGPNMLAAVNAPAQALLGRPLIGNGANGAPGTGQAGGDGGLLFGNGGNGGIPRPGIVAGARPDCPAPQRAASRDPASSPGLGQIAPLLNGPHPATRHRRRG